MVANYSYYQKIVPDTITVFIDSLFSKEILDPISTLYTEMYIEFINGFKGKLAFNKKESVIMYWDEPTITMDYKSHKMHDIIHNNWRCNEIPNIVLSSATLPNSDEIIETIADFKERFDLIPGLSDHTLGIQAPVIATSLGAKIIEKHFCHHFNASNGTAHFPIASNYPGNNKSV